MKTYQIVTMALFAAAAAVFQLLHGVMGIPTGFGMTVDLAGLPVLLAFFLFGFESALGVCLLLAIIITLVSPETWLGASMKFAGTLPMILTPALWLLAGRKKNDFGRIAAILMLSATAALALFVLSGFINTSLWKPEGGVLYTVPEVRAAGAEVLARSEVTPAVLLGGVAPIAGLTLASLAILYIWRRYGEGLKVSEFSDMKSFIPAASLAILVRGVTMVIANYYYAGPIFFGMQPEQLMAIAPWYVIFGWNILQAAIEMGFAWAIAFKFRFIEYYGSYR